MIAYRAHDATALLLLRDQPVDFVPAKTGLSHFHDVLATLQRTRPEGVGMLTDALQAAPDYCRRRGLVVVISDFFDTEGDLLARLKDLRAWGHDVIVIQVVDAWEQELPESGHFLVRDLETGVEMRTDAAAIRTAATDSINAWRDKLRQQATQAGIDWLSITTDQPLAELMTEYLIRRAETRRS
jgi:uncharacterized protein (DUF58 family)